MKQLDVKHMKKIYFIFVVFLFFPTSLMAKTCAFSDLTPLRAYLIKSISEIKSLSKQINQINDKTADLLKQDAPSKTNIIKEETGINPDIIFIEKISQNDTKLSLHLGQTEFTWFKSDCHIIDKAIEINENQQYGLCKNQNIEESKLDLFYRNGYCEVDLKNDEFQEKFFEYLDYLDMLLKVSKETNQIVFLYEKDNSKSGELMENTYTEIMSVLDKMKVESNQN